MHQRIEKLYEQAVKKCPNLNDIPTLLGHLSEMGTTITEAWLILYQGYGLDQNEAEKLILDNELWGPEPYADIMYEVGVYLKGQ